MYGTARGATGAVKGLVNGGEYHRRVHGEVRGGEVEAPADKIAEDVRLVYGLVRPGLAKLGWAVGGEQDHGHAVGRGLDDGGEAVGDRRAGGRDPSRRQPRGPRVTQGGEGRTALVEVDEAPGLLVGGECRDQRGRARTGGDAEEAHAAIATSSSTMRLAQRRLARGEAGGVKPEHPGEVADLLLDLGPLGLGHGALDYPGPRERARLLPRTSPDGSRRQTRRRRPRSSRPDRRTSPRSKAPRPGSPSSAPPSGTRRPPASDVWPAAPRRRRRPRAASRAPASTR